MITENIITALITGLLAFAGVLVSNLSNNRKNNVEQALRDQQIKYEISELSKRVDKHNGMLDKVANIEKSIIRIETKLEDERNA